MIQYIIKSYYFPIIYHTKLGGVFMRLKSLVSSVLMVTILSFGPNASAASEQSVYEGVAYSKVDLSEVGSLSKIALIQGKEKLSVSSS